MVTDLWRSSSQRSTMATGSRQKAVVFRVHLQTFSMSMLPQTPLPPTLPTLEDYWGCLVHCETYLVKFLVKSYQNNAREGRPKFDKLKVRGSV